jgi:D-alanyl-D-alanine carboxypeptidase/D-alanyl-D-alanine-endopeptidase (penicillin-binding protein 4)
MILRRFIFVLLLCISASCASHQVHRVPLVHSPSPPKELPLPNASTPVADLLLLRPAPDRVGQLRTQIDQLIQANDLEQAQWGIKIISIDRNEVLYERNSRIPIIPASNMKIVTAAAALLRLGPDFHYETKLITNAPIVNGILKGDLAVIGSGDPTFSARMQGDPLFVFRDWADELKAAGIRKIEGSVIGIDTYFDDQRVGEGWPSSAYNAPYAAEVSALQLNDNVIAVRVKPGKKGRLASIALYPATRYVRVQNSVITSSGHSNRFVAYRMENTNTIVVRGRIGTRDSADVRYITVHDPAGYFTAVLKETLEKKGIRSKGFRRASREEAEQLTDPARSRVLVTDSSPSLSEIVSEMMKTSQNLFADSLAKTVSATDHQTGSFSGAEESIRRILTPFGISPQELVMQDGSGLSSYDTVTANLLTQILYGMAKHNSFQDFYASFPVAGVDGTLRHRMSGTIAEGRVHAKTGYIGSVRSLSGYVQTLDGEHLAFSLITNNFDLPLRGVDSTHEQICTILTQFSRR